MLREYTLVLNFVACARVLCSIFPSGGLSSLTWGLEEVELSAVMEPLLIYLLSSQQESNFFTDPESITKCIEVIDSFGIKRWDKIITLWYSSDIHGRELSNPYKAHRVASDVESSSRSSVNHSPDKLVNQRRIPAQRHKFDLVKTGRRYAASNFASKLGSPNKTGRGDSWRIVVCFVYIWSCFLFFLCNRTNRKRRRVSKKSEKEDGGKKWKIHNKGL